MPTERVSRIAKPIGSAPTLAHDLVYLAVLLSTHKLLVLVGKLDLDTDLVLGALDKGYLVDDHHGGFDSVVRSVNGESQLIEANLGSGIRANIRKHGANVSWRRSPHGSRLRRLGQHEPP